MVRSYSLDIDPALRGQQRLLAIARQLGAGGYLNPPGERDLYEADAFSREGIALERLGSEDPESIRADVR